MILIYSITLTLAGRQETADSTERSRIRVFRCGFRGAPGLSARSPSLHSVHQRHRPGLQLHKAHEEICGRPKAANTIRTVRDMEDLQDCLNRLVTWADTWGMEFNVTKCKVMHVGRNTMSGTKLNTTEVERDIGVVVHRSLRPSTQCAEASRRANVVLGQITRAFHYRYKSTFVKLYKQFVRPHLEFSVPAWSP